MSKPVANAAGDSVDAQPELPAEQVQARTAAGRRELSGKLAGLSLRRQVMVLAVWPLLEQFLNFLVGFVDMVLAGRLRPETLAVSATAALAVGAYVSWLMSIFHSAVGIGSIALIARATGARHRGLARAALGQAMLLSLVSGVGAGILIFVSAPWIAALSGLKGDGFHLAVTYMRVVTLSAPFSALMLVGNACLRGAGDTRTPFFVMVLVNIANAVLSILFVYGPGRIGGHGVAGIAAGTSAAWVIGAIVILVVLLRGWGGIRLHWHRLRPHWHTMRRILRVAGPNLFESVGGMWLGNFLVLMIVGRLASEALIGAHLIVIRVESISFFPGFALGMAAATLTGQYLGLGDPHRAKQAIQIAWRYAAIFMTCAGIVFILIPRQLAGTITHAPELLDLTETPLRLTGLVQFFFATSIVLSSALRGAGDTRTTFRVIAGSTLLVRMPAVFVAGIVLDGGLTGVWIALCAELMLRGIIIAAVFLRGGWMRVKV